MCIAIYYTDSTIMADSSVLMEHNNDHDHTYQCTIVYNMLCVSGVLCFVKLAHHDYTVLLFMVPIK